MTRRRVVVGVVGLLVLAVAWTVWTLYAAQRDLRAAEQDARDLQAAVEAGDVGAAERALDALQDSASSAEGHTGGLWWSMLTVTPAVGDDLAGVRGVSASLDEVASGAEPLIGLADDVDTLVADGAVDLDRLDDVATGVASADDALDRAAGEVDDLDTTGYAGPLRNRVEEYRGLLDDVRRTLGSARTAADVAPTVLGADGPRDYLVVFQNNAEIRASGGLSGAWARVHTEDGRVELVEQGSAGDFPVPPTPIVPITDEEDAVYSDVVARYFADPVSVPDFPRAAELYDAFWSAKYPAVDLDGVLTLDTVTLSYLLRGTGPVTSDGATLTPDNAVRVLLNLVYLEIDDPVKQDEFFSRAASAIFTSATTGVSAPTDLVGAVRQAVGERRLRLASFDDPVRDEIAGTAIAGEFGGDPGTTPQVDVTLDDATGSKMSYYLDYEGTIAATSCADGVQELSATLDLRQVIPFEEARRLPDYITGGGQYGITAGSQQVQLRIYAPYAGTLGPVSLDGVELPGFTQTTIDGREVVTIPLVTDGSADLHLEWTMTSGPGQTGGVVLQGTPKVTPGNAEVRAPTAC